MGPHLPHCNLHMMLYVNISCFSSDEVGKRWHTDSQVFTSPGKGHSAPAYVDYSRDQQRVGSHKGYASGEGGWGNKPRPQEAHDQAPSAHAPRPGCRHGGLTDKGFEVRTKQVSFCFS